MGTEAHTDEDIEELRRLVREAAKLAEAIPDPHLRSRLLASSAQLLVHLGKCDEAIGLTHSIPDQHMKDLVSLRVVEVLARAGHWNEASSLVGVVSDDEMRELALAEVDGALADNRQHSDAIRLADTLVTPRAKDSSLRHIVQAAAKRGDHDEALALAGTISEGYIQNFALRSVVHGMAKSGEWERVAGLASEMPDFVYRRSLIQQMVLAGRAGAAANLAQSRESAEGQAEDFAHLAKTLAYMGAEQEALSYAHQASSITRTLVDHDEKSRALMAITKALAQAGEYELGVYCASSLTAPSQRAWSFSIIVKKLCEQGKFEAAARIARDSTGRAEQVKALSGVIASMGRSGLAEAAILADEAVQLINEIADQNDRDDTLAALAVSHVYVGDVQTANSLSDRIEDATEQARARVTIAEALTEAGLHSQARSLAEGMPSPWDIKALVTIAWVMACDGHIAEAAALAHGATDRARAIFVAEERVDLLTGIAMVFGRIGEVEKAIALSSEVGSLTAASIDPFEPVAMTASALQASVEGLADEGRFDAAVTFAENFLEGDHQYDAFVAVSLAMVRRGQLEAAKKNILHLRDPMDRAWALATLAEVLAGEARATEAEDFLWSATNIIRSAHPAPSEQAILIARVAAQVGLQGDRMRNLAAEALATCHWTDVVDSLAVLAPDSLPTLARLVRAEDPA